MSSLSDNFEQAWRRVEELEKENQILKEQLSAPQKEELPEEELPQENKSVDFHNSQRVSTMTEERDAAMKRYTEKIQRDIKTFKKDANGKT